MPRIAPLEPPYEPGLQQAFDAIMQGARPLLLFRTVAKSERAWRKFTAGSLLDRGPLSLRAREIVIDRTTALNACEYEWGVHVTTFAAAARFTEAEIMATTAKDPVCPSWTPAERALIAAVDALQARSTLSDAEFGGLRAHYDEAQVLEIIQLCGFYRMVSYMANALALPLEANGARFPTAA
jgi:alkylhydroperoxidase family enzyme